MRPTCRIRRCRVHGDPFASAQAAQSYDAQAIDGSGSITISLTGDGNMQGTGVVGGRGGGSPKRFRARDAFAIVDQDTGNGFLGQRFTDVNNYYLSMVAFNDANSFYRKVSGSYTAELASPGYSTARRLMRSTTRGSFTRFEVSGSASQSITSTNLGNMTGKRWTTSHSSVASAVYFFMLVSCDRGTKPSRRMARTRERRRR